MRARIIKPEFFTSRSLAKCSRDARLMFQGLWVNCDAVGRGKADPRIVKGAVFPLDDDLTLDQVESLLAELADTNHIVIYTHDDEPLYEVVNFAKHQAKSYRTGEAKHPGPDDEGSIRADCTTSHATCTTSRALREGKGSEVNVQPAAPLDTNDTFPDFWKLYPRREAKKRAESAWRGLNKGDQADALEALPKHIKAWSGRSREHIPLPTSWLNGRRWEDEIADTRKRGGQGEVEGGGYVGGDW